MVSSLKYMYKEIEINKLYKDKIEKSEMKMFSLKLDSETQGKDLIVDARMEGLTDHVLESPIVVVSLVIILM